MAQVVNDPLSMMMMSPSVPAAASYEDYGDSGSSSAAADTSSGGKAGAVDGWESGMAGVSMGLNDAWQEVKEKILEDFTVVGSIKVTANFMEGNDEASEAQNKKVKTQGDKTAARLEQLENPETAEESMMEVSQKEYTTRINQVRSCSSSSSGLGFELSHIIIIIYIRTTYLTYKDRYKEGLACFFF